MGRKPTVQNKTQETKGESTDNRAKINSKDIFETKEGENPNQSTSFYPLELSKKLNYPFYVGGKYEK